MNNEKGYFGKDLSDLGQPEKFPKKPLGETPPANPKAMDRRSFLKLGLGAAATALFGGKIIEKLIAPDKAQEAGLERLHASLDRFEDLLTDISTRIDETDTASLDNAGLQVLMQQKDLCALARLQLGNLRQAIDQAASDPREENIKDVREKFDTLIDTYRQLTAGDNEGLDQVDQALKTTIHI